MSLFRRVLSRAGVPGGAPVARRKGLPLASRATDEMPEDSDREVAARPLPRAVSGSVGVNPVPTRTLRRAPAPPDSDEDPDRPLHRDPGQEAEEDADAPPMRRATAATTAANPEDGREEDVAALRRAALPDDAREDDTSDDARPMRRAPAPEVPDDDRAQPLRRASGVLPAAAALPRSAPSAQTLDAETSPKQEREEGDPGPSPAMALRQLASATMPAPAAAIQTGAARPALDSPPAAVGPDPRDAPAEPEARENPGYPRFAPPAPAATATERPRVIIEQVDVVIHEPTSAAPSAPDAANIRRSLRSRYLQA